VPLHVNEAVAEAAKKCGVPVMQDIGGMPSKLSRAHLSHCTCISPNLTELKRLLGLLQSSQEDVKLIERLDEVADGCC
jgi:sugar/nucleoside kinase (ribokinase family)